jgi:HKD family nuclease
MRQDLIKLIEAQEDVTNVIVLTHNIDFVFIQLIVLPALRRCGQPTLTIFSDAQCATETFAYQSPVLTGLGIRYRVVPVAMEYGFRFHPKSLLLSSPAKATLLVGSGNLTFGGWRENAEIWIRFDSDKDSTAPFAAFRAYLSDILTRVPLTGPIQDEVEETFDGHTRPWAREMDPPSGLLGKVGRGPTLLEQMKMFFPANVVKNLVVCSPYFDKDGEALDKILGQFGPVHAEILVQKKYPGLPKTAMVRLPKNVKAVPISFTRVAENDLERESFVHAKFYAISDLDRTTVFAGSANCSRAALTVAGKNGNAELLAVQTLNPDEFQNNYLDEISKLEGALQLPDPEEEEDLQESRASIRILGAHYDNGLLQIAYECWTQVEITRCLADGIDVPFSIEAIGLGSVEIHNPPKIFHLEGRKGHDLVISKPFWVDVERELRSTSRGRSLAGVVRGRVQAGLWGIGAWKEVLDVFCKHLQYLPPRGSGWGQVKGDRRAKILAEFTAKDVFSTTYGLPSLGSAVRGGLVDDRVHSLQQMLLRWFGIHSQDEPEPEGNGEPTVADDDDDDVVDLPEQLPHLKTLPPNPKPVTDSDRKRAKKSMDQMTQAMTNEDFLAHRPPELLAADLKIAAVLLRTGLKEGWIDGPNFFEATRLVWSSLFFSSDGNIGEGWLERRQRESEDPDGFILRMASPELSAAIAAWAMAVPLGRVFPEHAAHALAQVLAIARLPWLWRGGETERIGEELGRILLNTEETLSKTKLKGIEKTWLRLIRRGEALRVLEETLSGHLPAVLRDQILQDHVSCGELLWQGRSGYCVALEDCHRSQINKIQVLKLQGMKKESAFQSEYLIPLRSLLDTNVLPDTDRLGPEARRAILELIEEIARPFSSKRS